MNKAKKTVAVALAAVFGCGMLAGCDLVTKNTMKDYAQVVATVNLTESEDFKDSAYADYGVAIQPTDITKLDMIAYYVSTGYAYSSYFSTSAALFDWICNQLVTREINIQYAIMYLLKNKEEYTIEGYNAAVENGDELAGIEYFLSEEEIAKAKYSTRLLFNNTLDSQETDFIDSETSETGTTERTLPTGVNTANGDYYDASYAVYTGLNSASSCGSYEAQEGSTSFSRKKAYRKFISSLRRNNLLAAGDNTNYIEQLSYFKTQLKGAYDNALITKLSDCFEAEVEKELTAERMQDYYAEKFDQQAAAYEKDKSVFESALDSMSDSSFVLTAPEANYGFVLNILLPFSSAQSAILGGFTQDYEDEKGNTFQQRAALLEKISATDQRKTWFTGEEDYSFESEAGYGYAAGRNYLFFEDSLAFTAADDAIRMYESIPNYYGKYSYNGDVYYNETTKKYTIAPAKISIDDFITEMEGYLNFAGQDSQTGFEVSDRLIDNRSGYYTRENSEYYTLKNQTKVVDYSKFIYYAGRVSFRTPFDANNLFVEGTQENVAFSVINELSFAYNTDTAGLNSYLGYSVVVGKTNYVGEFEYAAQYACEQGAGTYVVVPSDYGWHIIYCTFSFVAGQDGIEPFAYNHEDALNKEGSFSNLFYEAYKAAKTEEYSNTCQSEIVNAYYPSTTIYESRYADLAKVLDS